MTYKLKDPDKRLDAWLDTEPPSDVRARVLMWLFELTANPEVVASTPVPLAGGLPLLTAIVPLTHVAVTYILIKSPPYPEDLAAVVLRRIESVVA